MRYFSMIMLVSLTASCSSKGERKIAVNDSASNGAILTPTEGLAVSLVKLIANPERYEGKVIQVVGYLNLEFEGDAIYLHKEDYEHGLIGNGFWLDFSGPLKKTDEIVNSKKYVIIVGRFDSKSHGHMGLFGGTLKDISRLDVW